MHVPWLDYWRSLTTERFQGRPIKDAAPFSGGP